MLGDKNITDYSWHEPRSCAHVYLFKTIEEILQRLNIPVNARILDAGCGGGNCTNWLYQKGYKDVWGFDASESGIQIAKKIFVEIQAKFQLHNVYEKQLPSTLPQDDYDVVFSMEVIEHLYSPKTCLTNIHQWLKNDGYLILSTPYHGYWKNLAISILNQFDKHVSSQREGGHIKFFSRNTIFRILKECGLIPVQFYGSGRLPYFWKSMVIVAKKD